jgi:(R,R)-butanediol dehydrogenase/meso-butanediol dehydrogenase/diacetyl reductase
MRAARFYTAGDVRIEDVPAPTGEVGPYDVLVRNRECGICGTDLHEYSHGPIYTTAEAHPVTGVSLPAILGHEYAGLVEAVGSACAASTRATGSRSCRRSSAAAARSAWPGASRPA